MDYCLISGIRVYAPASRSTLIDHVFANKGILVAVNAEKILHATNQMRDIINRNVGYPDGFGAVLGLRVKGRRDAIKVAGCELWLEIIRLNSNVKTFYLVGATNEVIDKTVSKLRCEFPDISIMGYRNGYFDSDAEVDILISDILRCKPDVVFVAMGSPRQELLMELLHRHHPAVYQGLGGSFDVYIGNVRRAPALWVKYHFEWLYRLIQEPARIKRQVHLLRFLLLLLRRNF